MKKLSKILVLVLAMAMMFAMTSMFTASAATPATIYFTPNANWKVDNARFAARFWTNTPSFKEEWVSMTDPDGDGVYECQVPAGMNMVMICRMNPSTSDNNWGNKWNQTGDFKHPSWVMAVINYLTRQGQRRRCPICRHFIYFSSTNNI